MFRQAESDVRRSRWARTVARVVSDAPSLDDAVALAIRAHAGQLDKVGEEYIGHPLRVMRAVVAAADEAGVDREHAQMAAVLHDIVEDSAVTVEDLVSLGYPPAVVAAVNALSHRPGEPVEDYLLRVAADDLAVAVKRVDMADNGDPARLARLPADRADRYAQRYSSRMRLLDDLVTARKAAEEKPAEAAEGKAVVRGNDPPAASAT